MESDLSFALLNKAQNLHVVILAGRKKKAYKPGPKPKPKSKPLSYLCCFFLLPQNVYPDPFCGCRGRCKNVPPLLSLFLLPILRPCLGIHRLESLCFGCLFKRENGFVFYDLIIMTPTAFDYKYYTAAKRLPIHHLVIFSGIFSNSAHWACKWFWFFDFVEQFVAYVY